MHLLVRNFAGHGRRPRTGADDCPAAFIGPGDVCSVLAHLRIRVMGSGAQRAPLPRHWPSSRQSLRGVSSLSSRSVAMRRRSVAHLARTSGPPPKTRAGDSGGAPAHRDAHHPHPAEPENRRCSQPQLHRIYSAGNGAARRSSRRRCRGQDCGRHPAHAAAFNPPVGHAVSKRSMRTRSRDQVTDVVTAFAGHRRHCLIRASDRGGEAREPGRTQRGGAPMTRATQTSTDPVMA